MKIMIANGKYWARCLLLNKYLQDILANRNLIKNMVIR